MTTHGQRMRQLMETARQNLRRDGDLAPVLYVEGLENALVAIADMPGSADGRADVLRKVGRRLAPLRPTRVTAVVDAYLGLGAVPGSGSLADDPKATECVVVSSLGADGVARVLTCAYERVPRLSGTEFVFGEVREMGGEARMFLLEAFFEGAREAGR